MRCLVILCLLWMGASVDLGASGPKIQQNIHDLKDLGYTGKGVKVGVLDIFDKPNSHGCNFPLRRREFMPVAK